MILTVIATLFGTGCGPQRDGGAELNRPADPPNIILVLVDALRRDHVGLYGYPEPTTPFVDELGAGGLVFDDALSQAPQTLNSTASLFTSRNYPYLLWGVEHDAIPGVAPERASQWARTPRLAAANLSLAEVLGSGGYQTVALFNNPHHHSTSGFSQGFDTARLLARDADQAYARADSVFAAFLDWHDGRDRDRPYFAYLHLMDPHNPYRPPATYRELFPPGPGQHLYVNGPPPTDFTDDDLETMIALYNAEIRFLDDSLRALMGELDLRGDTDDTLIIVTADHGDEFLDHGGLGHGKTMELELLRIPLLMAGKPVNRVAGTRVETMVRNLDLAPTMVELAGIDVPTEFQGTSLAPQLRGTEPSGDSSRVSYGWVDRLRSLTTAEWHCVRDLESDRLTLYHRTTDPKGRIDVAAEHPEIAELCIQELDRLEIEGRKVRQRARVLKALETGSEMPAENEAILEQLKALGYVE